MPPTVFVVDDDAIVRDALSLLLETQGIAAECHESAEAFLAGFVANRPGCLLLDMRMGGMSGLDLQAELARRGSRLPIIFLTAHGDIPTTVRAVKSGAMDFLTKPVDGTLLLERVQAALSADQEMRRRDGQLSIQRARLVDLTAREREIMALAIAGHSNKDIAKRLEISHRTVETHRSHILQKTGAASTLELAKIAADCGLATEPARTLARKP